MQSVNKYYDNNNTYGRRIKRSLFGPKSWKVCGHTLRGYCCGCCGIRCTVHRKSRRCDSTEALVPCTQKLILTGADRLASHRVRKNRTTSVTTPTTRWPRRRRSMRLLMLRRGTNRAGWAPGCWSDYRAGYSHPRYARQR